VAALVRAGVPLCLGTDSAASNLDLGIWGEMRAVHALAPDLSVARLLAMATANGARALALDDVVGSLRPGRVAAALVLSEAPPRLDDLEALLLSLEVEDRVRRLDAI
jgi:cytosine/adenosine deaminase-related metal-dependent hydrolase